MTALSTVQFDSLIAAAMAAPSADNRHVFRLEACAEGLRVLGTADFMRASASRRVLGLISLGAMFQNLQVRAAMLGLRLNAAWQLRPPAGSTLLADMAASEVDAIPDGLDPAIEARHTNRRLRFEGPALSPSEQEAFAGEAASIPGASLVWLDSAPRRRAALRLVRRAERERFCNEELHRELFDSIRFDVGWQASAAEGLPPGSLELPLFERPTFAALRRWPVQRAANLIGVDRFIAWRAADLPCRLAPHLCVVAGAGPVDAAAIASGELLQRLWLRATLAGLSMQVFAGSALYALPESTAIDDELRNKLAAGWAELCSAGRPFVAFRMGHAEPPTVRAGRPQPDCLRAEG